MNSDSSVTVTMIGFKLIRLIKRNCITFDFFFTLIPARKLHDG